MRIINQARSDFQYRFSADSPIISETIYSNKVYTTIVPALLTVEKYVDKSVGSVYDILTYTVVIKNISDILVKSIYFEDFISPSTEFIKNSLTVNDKILFCKDLSKPIFIGSLNPNGEINITFKVLIKSSSTGKVIDNYSNIIFDYIFNILEPPVLFTLTSNTVHTLVQNILFKQFNYMSTIPLPMNFNNHYSITKINSFINIIGTKFTKAPMTNGTKLKENGLCNLIVLGKIHYEIIYQSKHYPYKYYKHSVSEGLSTFLLVPFGASLSTLNTLNINIEDTDFVLNRNTLLINSNLLASIV